MIFKNRIEFNQEERLVLKALVQTTSVESLFEQLHEFEDDLALTIKALNNKLDSDNTFEDLMIEIKNLKSIILEKNRLVEKQKYVEAAHLRDKETQSLSKLNLGFNLEIRMKDLQSYQEELKEYLLYKDAKISENSNISLLIQPGTASKEDVGNLLSELSKLYKMVGGSGITFRLDEIRNPKFKFDHE
ncbi:hypothetical protein [Euzebyella saccharophila]|uniref:Uncharacterized protein n=1 Tax=Euzebyella saccharophila TaxID=679664 RepID=A0ABV8JNK9_9FLAO|nr:hypothetical protein [Euzebyella saccharophila]